MPQVGTYKGDFRNGKYDGAGTLFLRTGTSASGQFRSGLLNGPCTLKLKDGVVMNGGYRYGVPDGKWSREEADGTKKEWQIKDGVLKEIDKADEPDVLPGRALGVRKKARRGVYASGPVRSQRPVQKPCRVSQAAPEIDGMFGPARTPCGEKCLARRLIGSGEQGQALRRYVGFAKGVVICGAGHRVYRPTRTRGRDHVPGASGRPLLSCFNRKDWQRPS